MSYFLLTRNDDGFPTFYSCKVGRELGSPVGGWSDDKKKALRFSRAEDAQDFMEMYLPHSAAYASVSQHTTQGD